MKIGPVVVVGSLLKAIDLCS